MTDMRENRWRPHPALVAGGAVALIVGAVGVGAFAVDDGAARSPKSSGDQVTIELVAPVEPRPEPGEVMDVGEVTDGFTYVRSQMEPEPPIVEDYWVEEPEYEAPTPSVRRYGAPVSDAAVYPLVRVPPPAPRPSEYRRGDRSFGFDRPRPDYRALREARRARLDALAQRSSERSRDWEAQAELGVMPPEAIRRSESTFY